MISRHSVQDCPSAADTADPLDPGDPPSPKSLVGWLFVAPGADHVRASSSSSPWPYGPVLAVPLGRRRPATWVGLSNYAAVLSEPRLLETLFNAFRLVIFFSLIPVALGLVTASIIHRVATGRLGTVSRTVLFLPQVIPLVAAGIIWGRLLSLPASSTRPDGDRPGRHHPRLAR